jgi:hypothetical protein
MSMTRTFVVCAGLASLMLATPSAVTPQLQDGTIVHMRLLSPVTSEDANAGDSIAFVVTKDVIANGVVVIAHRTPALGTVVVARRANWGFGRWYSGRLSLAFMQTTAVDGQTIRLRATNGYGQVNIDRGDYHHAFQWATEGDTFDASVAGTYELSLK